MFGSTAEWIVAAYTGIDSPESNTGKVWASLEGLIGDLSYACGDGNAGHITAITERTDWDCSYRYVIVGTGNDHRVAYLVICRPNLIIILAPDFFAVNVSLSSVGD